VPPDPYAGKTFSHFTFAKQAKQILEEGWNPEKGSPLWPLRLPGSPSGFGPPAGGAGTLHLSLGGSPGQGDLWDEPKQLGSSSAGTFYDYDDPVDPWKERQGPVGRMQRPAEVKFTIAKDAKILDVDMADAEMWDRVQKDVGSTPDNVEDFMKAVKKKGYHGVAFRNVEYGNPNIFGQGANEATATWQMLSEDQMIMIDTSKATPSMGKARKLMPTWPHRLNEARQAALSPAPDDLLDPRFPKGKGPNFIGPKKAASMRPSPLMGMQDAPRVPASGDPGILGGDVMNQKDLDDWGRGLDRRMDLAEAQAPKAMPRAPKIPKPPLPGTLVGGPNFIGPQMANPERAVREVRVGSLDERINRAIKSGNPSKAFGIMQSARVKGKHKELWNDKLSRELPHHAVGEWANNKARTMGLVKKGAQLNITWSALGDRISLNMGDDGVQRLSLSDWIPKPTSTVEGAEMALTTGSGKTKRKLLKGIPTTKPFLLKMLQKKQRSLGISDDVYRELVKAINELPKGNQLLLAETAADIGLIKPLDYWQRLKLARTPLAYDQRAVKVGQAGLPITSNVDIEEVFDEDGFRTYRAIQPKDSPAGRILELGDASYEFPDDPEEMRVRQGAIEKDLEIPSQERVRAAQQVKSERSLAAARGRRFIPPTSQEVSQRRSAGYAFQRLLRQRPGNIKRFETGFRQVSAEDSMFRTAYEFYKMKGRPEMEAWRMAIQDVQREIRKYPGLNSANIEAKTVIPRTTGDHRTSLTKAQRDTLIRHANRAFKPGGGMGWTKFVKKIPKGPTSIILEMGLLLGLQKFMDARRYE
jgi:hypothetical protein